MDTEERIKVLEDDFNETKQELRQMLYDIRTWIMEAESPIPNDLEKDRLSTLIAETEAE